MNELNFIYLQVQPPEADTIICGKYDGKLYVSSSMTKNGKAEFFVNSIGWKKSKPIAIPRCTATTDEGLTKYLNEYGADALYFSLTENKLHSADCCHYRQRSEFLSAVYRCGFTHLFAMNADVQNLNRMIREESVKTFGVDIYDLKFISPKDVYMNLDDLFIVRPHHSIMGLLITAPHLDPVYDDTLLLKHFTLVNGLAKIDYDDFPVSVKDRLSFLFSENVSLEYERIMHKYSMTYDHNEENLPEGESKAKG